MRFLGLALAPLLVAVYGSPLTPAANLEKRYSSKLTAWTYPDCSGPHFLPIDNNVQGNACKSFDPIEIYAVQLEGEYLGWRLYTDTECGEDSQASTLHISGGGTPPHCYQVQGPLVRSARWVV